MAFISGIVIWILGLVILYFLITSSINSSRIIPYLRDIDETFQQIKKQLEEKEEKYT